MIVVVSLLRGFPCFHKFSHGGSHPYIPIHSNAVRSPTVHINMQQREDSEERVENEARKHLLRPSAIINYTVINTYFMQLQTLGWLENQECAHLL